MPPTRKAAATRPALPRRTQIVRTEEIEIPPDLSYIPDEVVDHFAAKGLHVSLASAHQDNAAALSLSQRYMVMADELPEPPERERLLRLLSRYAFRVDRNTGALLKGDCALYAQSFGAREAQIEESYASWLRQFGGDDRDANMIEELNESLRNTKARVVPQSISPLYEHFGRNE